MTRRLRVEINGPRAVSEAGFQAQIVELAELLGYLWWHDQDSRKNNAGFPDLHLLHPVWHRRIIAELKTEKGQPTAEQYFWLLGLIECGEEAYLWRPSDWESIVETLKNK
jgi:hypothetical protein